MSAYAEIEVVAPERPGQDGLLVIREGGTVVQVRQSPSMLRDLARRINAALGKAEARTSPTPGEIGGAMCEEMAREAKR